MSPLSSKGLDETFDLAIGLGRVGPGVDVANVEGLACVVEELGSVARASVRHDSLDDDSVIGIPGDSSLQESGHGLLAFIREDFDKGHTTMVVDSGMSVLPARPTGPHGAVAMDSMTDALDTPQLLGVQV